jgi:cyclophilin family peptidyl-prolyl cis-trans isomerase
MIRSAFLEPLEDRIAPALVVVNPIGDIVAGAGKNNAIVELSQLFDASVQNPGHTLVKFTLNLDWDPLKPGIQRDTDPSTPGVQPAEITIELFDDEAPLSVQNFLRYATNPDASADYIGTFLHRLFDFGSSSGPGMDIVQGGGFNVDTRDHIDTFTELHNEYSDSRPNTRGTIAMAKTGVSPNTATSEWFININDNTSILGGNNNGGFTVFGEVIQGMNIIDRIAALPKTNAGGAFTDLPVQNYSADPDSNPITPAPEVKGGNLIVIRDVEVIQPQPGNATGITFSAVSDNGVVVPVVKGTKLRLNYTPEMAGIANITVTATQGADTATETFTVTVLPDLIGKVSSTSLQRIIVPGDVGTANAMISNSGGGHFEGVVDIKFYLSKRTGTDQFGAILDDSDVLIGQVLDRAVSIPNGGSATVPGTISIPAELVDSIDAYTILVEISKDSGPAELFTDDNTGIGKKLHALTNQFGTASINFGSSQNPDVVTREGVKLVYLEPDGDRVTLGLKGKGTGQVNLVGDLMNIVATRTDSTTVLTAKAAGAEGRIAVNGIEIQKTIGTVNYKRVDLDGYFTASKGVQTLNLGDVSGGQVFTLGRLPATASNGTTLNLGRVHDVSIDSNQVISAINAVEWLDTTGVNDRIITPGISVLSITGGTDGATAIRGDFQADIIIEGNSTLNSIRVAGLLNDSFIKTNGSIGSVRIGGMISSSIFAGVEGDLRPDEKGDYSTPRRSISSFVITDALAGVTEKFADSQVAAFTIGKIVVRGVDTEGGGNPFGFVANTVASYQRVTGPTAADLTGPTVFDAQGNYSVTVL